MHYVYINQWVNEFVAKVMYLHHSQFLFWTYLCCGLPAMQIFFENPGLSGCVMCSKPSCLGNPWCSEWDCDCCASDPEFESDMKDFKGPPLKRPNLLCLGSPSLPLLLECKLYLKATYLRILRRQQVGLCVCSMSGELHVISSWMESSRLSFWRMLLLAI